VKFIKIIVFMVLGLIVFSTNESCNHESVLTPNVVDSTIVNKTSCDTTNIKFSTFIKPALTVCINCHVGGAWDMSSYDKINKLALNGELYGAIAWLPGYYQMPEDNPKFDTCTTKKILAWIKRGALNN
jgi:hypothetical protein